MLAPGLGEGLEFDVGKVRPKPDRFAGPAHLGVGGIGLQGLHLLEIKGEHPLLADAQQIFVGNIEIDPVNHRLDITGHLGDGDRHPRAGVEFRCGHDRPALDQTVGQKTRGDLLGLGLVNLAGEQVLGGGVDPLPVLEPPPGQILEGLLTGTTDVVGYAGTEPHLDQNVEVMGQRPVDRDVLNHRIGKRTARRGLDILFGKFGIHGVNIQGPDIFQVDSQVLLDFAPHTLAARIGDAIL